MGPDLLTYGYSSAPNKENAGEVGIRYLQISFAMLITRSPFFLA